MAGPGMSMPTPVKAPTYINNPSQYGSFDTSGLSQSEIANANQQGGNQIAQAKAQAAGMGGGRSSSAQNAVNSIQTGLGQNAQNIFNKNAQLSYGQQLGQQNAQNQYNLSNQANQNQAFANQGNLANTAYANQMNGVGQGIGDASSLISLLAML